MQTVFKALLDRDMNAIHALGKQGLFEAAFRVHAGMSVPDFQAQAREWLDTGVNPKLARPCREPDLPAPTRASDLLRENGFQTWIVSGGGADFIRLFAEEAYGVPPEQVVGSSVRTELRFDGDGKMQLFKRPELQSFDDREVKVENIGLHIGRRPLFAFGNSDGDLAMMRYVIAGEGRRMALLLHHDDAHREFAYDRDFRLSPLAEALDQAQDYGVTVVSMVRDWAQVFPSAR